MEGKKKRKQKTKFIVVGGYFSNGSMEFIQALGAFDTANEAYGKALLYLNDMAEGYGDERTRITPLMELEGETGYSMYLEGADGGTTDFAYVLFHKEESEEERDEENNI